MSAKSIDMFSAFEIGNSISKEQYESQVEQLRVALVNAQYRLRTENHHAVLILLAGNDRKSVNETIDILHEWLDARYVHTHVFLPPDEYEKRFPAHWRYWKAMPPQGRMANFVGAWPLRTLKERLDKKGSDEVFTRRIQSIKSLENSLVDNGVALLKFWLHVPKKIVKKQLEAAKKHPGKEPYLSQEDWNVYENYDKSIAVAEQFVRETSSSHAPWQLIEATDARYRNISVGRNILEALEHHMVADQVGGQTDNQATPKEQSATTYVLSKLSDTDLGLLDSIDLTKKLKKKEYKEKLAKRQSQLNRLVVEARDKFATVIVFEGWDASGKGGAIRRLTKAMFAQDYNVFPVAAPSEEENKYHYLWRFWKNIPRWGKIAIFDRSWYGRVLVERVEGFASDEEWQRAYHEINDFEEQLAGHGMALCKFWLHIDQDEQLSRFQEREVLPYKNHKITAEDYRNRDGWQDYALAVNEMLARTSTSDAPWHVVAANNKRWARIEVLEAVIETLENQLDKYRK